MTENTPERAAYLAEQAEAVTETASRDQQSWELNVRNGQAQAFQTEAAAVYASAKATFWGRVANAVTLLTVAAVVLAFATAFGWASW